MQEDPIKKYAPGLEQYQSPREGLEEPIEIDIVKTMATLGKPVEELIPAIGPYDKLTLVDPQTAAQLYGDKFASPEEFTSFYQSAVQGYEDMINAQDALYLRPQGTEEWGVGIGNPFYGLNRMQQAVSETMFVYDPGSRENWMKTETPSGNAGRQNFHVEPEFVINPQTMQEEYVGQKVVRGKITNKAKGLDGYYVTPLVNDEGEQITDEHGIPQYVYQKFADGISHYNLEKASIWGDQKLYGKSVLDPLLGFASAATVDFAQGAAQLGSLFTEAGMAVSGMTDEEIQRKKAEGGILGFFDTIIEGTEGMKYRPSAEMESSKFLGSGFAGFMYQTGVGLGYIMPQRAIPSLMVKGGIHMSKALLRTVASGIGTSQALNGFYRSAREAGLGETDAAYLSLFAMPAVASTEWALNSKWLTRGLGDNDQAIVTKYLKAEIDNAKLAGSNVSAPEVQASILKKTFKKIFSDEQMWTEGVSQVGYAGTRLATAATREGTQEATEEIWYATLENMYDKGFFHDMGITSGEQNTIGDGLFGTDKVFSEEQLSRYWDNFVGGFVVGGIMDAMALGQKDKYRENIFYEMVANRKTDRLLNFIENSFKENKMGSPQRDIAGNLITVNAEGAENAQTFEVPEDVVYDGKTYLQKGQVLKTTNDIAYYQSLQKALQIEELFNASGLNNPVLLREFIGQENLITDALKQFNSAQEITMKIEELETAKTQEGANVEELDAQIRELEAKRNEHTKEFEYLVRPVEGSLKSEAYINNVKVGIANGYNWNKNKSEFEKYPQRFAPITKETVAEIEQGLVALSEVRNNERNNPTLTQNEIKAYEQFEQGMRGFLEGGTDNSLDDILATLKSISSHHQSMGIGRDALDGISKNIISLAQDFSNQVKELYEGQGLTFDEQNPDALGQLDAINQERRAKGEESLVIDPNVIRDLEKRGDVVAAFGDLTGFYQDPNVREAGTLSREQDESIVNKVLWNEKIGEGANDYIDVASLIEELEKLETISPSEMPMGIAEMAQKLGSVDVVLDYADAINTARSRPNYHGILDHEPATIVTDNNVVPGHDIPAEYMQSLRDKNADLWAKLERIQKKLESDLGNLAKHEQQRYYVSNLQKAYMLNKVWENAQGSLHDIASHFTELKALADEVEEAGISVDPVILKTLAQRIIDIETWMYDKGQSVKGFHKKLMTDLFLKDDSLGAGQNYYTVVDSRISFYRKKDGDLVNLNDVSFSRAFDEIGDAKKKASIIYFRMTNYLNNILNISSKEFNNMLRNELVADPEAKLPGVEQTETIRSILTSVILPHTEGGFYVRVHKGNKPAIIDAKDNGPRIQIKAFNAVSVDGGGGVGKTTVIAGTSMKIASKMLSDLGVKVNVIGSGPSSALTNKLSNSLLDSLENGGFGQVNAIEYSSLMDIINGKTADVKLEDALLIIDESSRVTRKDMIKISEVASEMNATIIFLGDSMQATDKDPQHGNIPPVPYNQQVGIRTSRINMKFRTGIIDISKLQDAIAYTIKGVESREQIYFPNVRYNESHTKGVRYVLTENDVKNHWRNDITDGNERVIIFETKSKADAFKRELKGTNLEKHDNLVRYVFNNHGNDTNNETVQGLEFDNVYVAISDFENIEGKAPADIVYQRRLLLTAQSRAKNFVMMPAYSDVIGKSRLYPDAEIVDYSDQDINVDVFNIRGEATEEDQNDRPDSFKKKPKKKKEKKKKEKPDTTKDEQKNDKSKEGNVKDRVLNPYHPLMGQRLMSKNGDIVIVTGVYELGDRLDLITLSNGTEIEGPDAMAKLYEEYEDASASPDSLNTSKFMVDTEEYSFETGDTNFRFLSSAMFFDAHGGVIPVMINVMPSKPGSPVMDEETYFGQFKKNYTPLEGSFDLRFHKSLDLYTRSTDERGVATYSNATHYNVLAIYDGEKLVGVMPTPDASFEDAQSKRSGDRGIFSSTNPDLRYTAASLSKNQDAINFSAEQDPNNRKMLQDYHRELVRLHTVGHEALIKSKSDSVDLGLMHLVGPSGQVGATVNITRNSWSNPRPLGEFIEEMEADGVAFERVGKNYTVIQAQGNNGEIRWYLKGSRLKTSNKKNAKPIHPSLIPVRPATLSSQDVKDIKAQIAALEKLARDDDGSPEYGDKFISSFYRSEAFQTLHANIRMITQYSPEGIILRPEFTEFLRYDISETTKGYSGTLKAMNDRKGGRYYDMVKDLRSAFNQLNTTVKSENRGIYTWYPITRNQAGQTIVSNIDKLQTSVAEIRGPYYRMKPELNDEVEVNPSGKETDQEDLNDNLDRQALMEGTDGLAKADAILKSKTAGISYLRSVLGDQYVDSYLSFTNDPLVDGKRAWGYVEGLKMVLRTSNNLVAEQAFRHEAIHIIPEYLMTDKARATLYRAVRSQHKGQDLSDADVQEKLAVMHQNHKKFNVQYKGISGVIQRFLDSLGRFFDNLKSHQRVLNDFFYRVDSGYYADKFNENIEPSSMERKLLVELEEFTEKEKSNNEKLAGLSRQLGSYDALNDAIIYTLEMIKLHSGASGILVGAPNNIIQAARAARRSVLKTDSVVFLNEKFKNADPNNLEVYLEDEYFEGNMAFIQKSFFKHILAQEDNFDVILKAIYKQNDVVSEKFAGIIKAGYEESAMRDPDQYVPHNVRMYLGTIPYHQFTETGKIAKTFAGNSRKYVDYNVLKVELIEAATAARSFGKTDIKAIFTYMHNKANKFSTDEHWDNETRNTILSFLEEFGKEYTNKTQLLKAFDLNTAKAKDLQSLGVDRPRFSHYMLATRHNDLLRIYEERKNKGQMSGEAFKQKKQDLMNRAEVSSSILNAVFSMANSRNFDFMTISMQYSGQGDPVFSRNIFYETSTANVKRFFKGAIDSLFMNGDRNYTPSALSKVDGTGSFYNVLPGYINRAGRGRILVKRGDRWEWNDDNISNQMRDFGQFARFLGLSLHPGAVRNLFTNKPLQERYQLNGNDLADWTGHMLSSVRANQQFAKDSDDGQRMRDSIIKFAKDHNMDGRVKNHVLTDFYPLIDALADVQAFLSARRSPNFVKTVTGNSKSVTSLPSALSDRITNVPNGNASDHIATHIVDTIVENQAPEALNQQPMAVMRDGEIVYTEPLLDQERYGITIRGVDMVNGIGLLYGGQEVGDWTEADYWNANLHGIFHSSVMKDYAHQVLDFTPENIGDSRQLPVFNVSFGNKQNPLLFTSKDKDGRVSMTVNEEVVNKHIDGMFGYHYKSMLISRNNWYRFFSEPKTDSDGKTTRERYKAKVDQEKYLEEQADQVMATMKDTATFLRNHKLNNKANHKKLVKELQAFGLKDNRDFVIKNGRVRLGNATEMKSHDIFNAYNFRVWQKMEMNSPEMQRFRDWMFRERFDLLARKIDGTADVAVQMPADLKHMNRGKVSTKKLSDTPQVTLGDSRKRKSWRKMEYEWHPFYKGFMYGYFITSNSVSNVVIGNENQFDNSTNKSKYNKGFNSSGLRGTVGGLYNLPATTNVVNISDKMGSYEEMGLLFNEKPDFMATDGFEIALPIVAHQLSHSLGGLWSMSRYNDKSIKSFYQGMDWKTHTSNQSKHAQLVLNNDVYKNTPWGKKTTEWMLTHGLNTGNNDINLYDWFQEIMAAEHRFGNEEETRKPTFEEGMYMLHKRIAEHDAEYPLDNIHDNYVGIISHESTNKIKGGYSNDVTIDNLSSLESPSLATRDNSSLYFQLNLNHEVDLDIARANQLEAIISTMTSTQAAEIIDNVNAAMARKTWNAIQADIKEAGGFQPYLKKIGLAAVVQMGRANILGDLFTNDNISVFLPMVLHTAEQAYISKVNQGINPRAVGSKMVQMPAEMELAEVMDAEGNTFFADASEVGKYKTTGRKSSLHHYRFLDKSGNNVTEELIAAYDGDYREDLKTLGSAINQYKRLEKYNRTASVEKKMAALEEVLSEEGLLGKIKAHMASMKEKVAHVTASQLAMNYPYRMRFGLSKTDTLNDALNLKIGDRSINVRAFIKSKMSPNDYYNPTLRNQAIDKHLVEWIGDEEGVENTEDSVQYYKDFLDTLIVYGTRIPTSHLSSAFYGEIELFTPDSKNIVYVSSEKNLLDGSDYDIDELSIYFKALSKGEVVRPQALTKFDDMEMSTLQNIKHDQMIGAFSDPANLDKITVPIDIANFRRMAEDKRKKNPHVFNNDFATSAFNFSASQEGKNMVARFANATVAYTRLARLIENSPELVSEFFRDDEGIRAKLSTRDFTVARMSTVLDTLSRVLQVAVDNPKEILLGYLNMNRASGNLVSALVMSNYTDEEIYEFLNQPMVASIIRKAFSTFSVTRKTDNIINIINAEITNQTVRYLSGDYNAYFEQKKKNLERAINNFIAQKAEELNVEIIEKRTVSDLPTSLEVDQTIAKESEDILAKAKAIAEEERDAYIDGRVQELQRKIAETEAFASDIEESMRGDAQEKIITLNQLKELYYKGEFLRRLISGFSLYTGIPSKLGQRSDFIQNIEFYMGMSLGQYNQDLNSENDILIDRAGNKIGVSEQDMDFSDRQTINRYVETFINNIVNDSEISPENVTFITGASEGFESEFLALVRGSGFDIKPYIASNKKTFTETGIMSTEKGESGDYEVDEEAKNEEDLKYKNVKKANITINFLAFTSARPIEARSVMNVLADEGDPSKIEEAVAKIRTKVRTADEGEKVIVQVTGSSLFKINTAPKSEYEQFTEIERNVRGMGDIASIYKQLPNINEYLRQLHEFEKSMERVYFKTRFIKDLKKQLVVGQRLDRLSQRQEIAFNNAVGNFILDMFYRSDVSGDLNYDLSVPGYKSGTWNTDVDLKEYFDRDYFVVEFPEMIRQLNEDIQSNPSHPLYKNLFLRSLQIFGHQLYFDGTFYEDTKLYKDHFMQMAKTPGYGKIAEMFKHYNLLTYGFAFREGSYREVIGDTFFEDISQYMVGVGNQLSQPEGKGTRVKSRFEQFFIPNLLMMDEEFSWAYFKDSDLRQKREKDEIKPQVYMEREVNTGAYKQRYVLNENGGYERVFWNATKKVKTIPSNRLVESDIEVIRLDNVEHYRRLRSNNPNFRLTFDNNHNYIPGDVFVNGRMASLSVIDPREIRLVRQNDNPAAAYSHHKDATDAARRIKNVVFEIDQVSDYYMEEVSGQGSFSSIKMNTILYNPRRVNPARSRIGDLAHMNAALLQAKNQPLYEQVVQLVNTSRYLNDHYKDDLTKVAAALSNERLFMLEEDISLLDKARSEVIMELGSLMQGRKAPSNIVYTDTLNDLVEAIQTDNNAFKEFHRSQRMNLISDQVGKGVIRDLVKQFGVPAEIITHEEAVQLTGEKDPPNGFYHKGKAYYVSGKMRADTPIHEMLHPFVFAVQVTNNQLYRSLIDEMYKSAPGQNILAYVNERYKDHAKEDRDREALVMLMGESIANIIPPSKNKGLIGKLKSMWNSIVNMLRRMFGKNVVPYKLSPNTTMAELADMISRGNRVVFTNYVSEAVELQRGENEPIKSEDLIGELLIPNDMKGIRKDFNTKMLDNRVAFIYNDLNQSKDRKYVAFVNGRPKVFSFVKEFEEGEAAVKAAIRDRIIPNMKSDEAFRKQQLISWINTPDANGQKMGMSRENQRRYFAVGDTNRRLYSPETLKEFKKTIRNNPGVIAVPYSKLAERFEGTNLDGMTSEVLMDRDPLIIIHRQLSNRSTGKVEALDISIYDWHNGNSNIFSNTGGMLFSNYITSKEQKALGINATNNLDEVRKLQMGLMAMKMVQAGGNVINIRNVGIMNMTSDSFMLKMADPSRLFGYIPKLSEIPGFFDELHDEIKDLVNDTTIREEDQYVPNYIKMLRSFLYEEREHIMSTGKKYVPEALQGDIEIIERYLVDGVEDEMITMLEHRRYRLEHGPRRLNTQEKRDTSDEYIIISNVLGHLKGFRGSQNNFKIKDANMYEQYVGSIHDMQNHVLQDFYSILRRQSKVATGLFTENFRKPFQEKIKDVTGVYLRRHPEFAVKERLAAIGHKRFDNMFKKRVVHGTDGKEYEINTFELHLDRSEPGASILSDEELALANFIADEIEKYMTDMFYHRGYMDGRFFEWDGERSVLNDKRLREWAEEQYRKHWKRGMLPLMHKNAAQHFFAGNLGKAGKRFVSRYSDPVQMFDDVLELKQRSGVSQEVHSHFFDQYDSRNAEMSFGTERRMNMLGVEGSGGDYYLPINDNLNGYKINQDLNTNLEDVMDFFVMDVIWKQTMDKEVLPEYNGAMTRLNAFEVLYSTDQSANKEHMRVMFDRVVRGQNQLEHKSKLWKNAARGLNVAYKLTSFSGVALSIPVAITSAVGNLTELNLNALATSIGNPYDIFTFKELKKGQMWMLKNAKLAEKLVHFYQVTEHERFDVLNNPRYKSVDNHVWTHRFAHIMNWITDYETRKLVMIAQMVHDGSLDAHSLDGENVVYDEKKDRRFYNADGVTQTKKQKALYDWVKRNLSNDPRVNQELDRPLNRGYDLDDQRKFEWITSYFVTGTYNNESTGTYDSYILGKVAAQFKKYFISKMEHRLGGIATGKKTKAEGGHKIIIEHEDGRLEEVWQKLETNGIYVEVAKYLVDDVLKNVFKGQKIEKLTEMQKYSLARTSGDAMIAAIIVLLWGGMRGFADDKEDEAAAGKFEAARERSKMLRERSKMLFDMRAISAVKNGLLGSLALTPMEIIQTLGIPSLETMKRIWNLILFNGGPDDIRRLLPLGATIDTVEDFWDYVDSN